MSSVGIKATNIDCLVLVALVAMMLPIKRFDNLRSRELEFLSGDNLTPSSVHSNHRHGAMVLDTLTDIAATAVIDRFRNFQVLWTLTVAIKALLCTVL